MGGDNSFDRFWADQICSGLISAVRITRVHLATSLAIRLPKSAGEPVTATALTARQNSTRRSQVAALRYSLARLLYHAI